MSKFECNLVMDLLPIYADGKAGKETEDFIRLHMESCPECREMYEAMTKDIDTKTTPVVISKTVSTPGKRLLCFALIYCGVLAGLAVLISMILIYGV